MTCKQTLRAAPVVRLLAFLLFSLAALAQNTPSPPKLAEEGAQAYAERCAMCHGPDADGTDRGPRLFGSRRIRSWSTAQLRRFLYDGAPSSGMPAFPLPAHELDALTAFVHSLNSAAAETPVPGDPAAGERFFFGPGQCAACHMVRGRGRPIGPDLSNTARELTLGEIRQALLRPGRRITPGYQLVSVRLRDGKTLRGFARGRTNYDIQLQDLQGGFHRLQRSQIAAIAEEKSSLMKPVAASSDELRDLIAYLCTLKGVGPGVVVANTHPEVAPIDFDRIRHPKPGDWLTYNGALNGNRYSELKQIDTTNVNKLAVKWIFPIDHFGLETTPVVADGIMYVTGPNQTIALDARTGRLIWKYARPRSPGLIGDAALGTHRGVALLGDKVFMVTDNAHLLALNRITGALVWDVTMPDEPMHYGSTVAPLPVKDMIIAGVSGGDRGMRGFLSAYKAATGERLWRFWTIPFKGQPGAETWQGPEPKEGGGATWLTGA